MRTGSKILAQPIVTHLHPDLMRDENNKSIWLISHDKSYDRISDKILGNSVCGWLVVNGKTIEELF